MKFQMKEFSMKVIQGIWFYDEPTLPTFTVEEIITGFNSKP